MDGQMRLAHDEITQLINIVVFEYIIDIAA